jgi:hypothetical protein
MSKDSRYEIDPERLEDLRQKITIGDLDPDIRIARASANVPDDPAPKPAPLDTLAKILEACQDHRARLAEDYKERPLSRGRRIDTAKEWSTFLLGELGDVYPLPDLEPLWTAAKVLRLPDMPPWREPENTSDAIGVLDTLIDLCRARMAEQAGQAAPEPENLPTADPPAPPEQMTPLAKAIAFMYARSKATGKLPTIKEVESITGHGKSSFYRDPAFKDARKAIKGLLRARIPRGHKTSAGNVEAYDD